VLVSRAPFLSWVCFAFDLSNASTTRCDYLDCEYQGFRQQRLVDQTEINRPLQAIGN
jgi:hypothetical protein